MGALRGRHGKQDTFRQSGVRWELHFVVGLGEGQNFSGRCFRFLIPCLDLFYGEAEARAQFIQRERFSQTLHDLAAEVAGRDEMPHALAHTIDLRRRVSAPRVIKSTLTPAHAITGQRVYQCDGAS